MVAWTWGVGNGMHLLLTHSHFMEVISPGIGERGRRRWLLNLRNIRCVALHEKKQNHNCSSPSAINLTNVSELPTNALMHLQREVTTERRLKLMQSSLDDVTSEVGFVQF